MKNISIIGSGSWGSALGIHLAHLGNNVKIWSYSQEEADLINNEKKCKFLPLATIPDGVVCTTDFKTAIEGTEMLLIVTPSKFVRETIQKFKQYVTDQEIIICSKGFEESTLYTLNEDDKLLKDVQSTFMNEALRIYTSYDIKGAELGGALKNIIAFCAGAITGLELGDNTFAALLTRGLSEMAKLSIKMGGEPKTIYGLTGLGDLIVTCMSNHSRNRRAGILIGQGKTIEEAKQESGMTIESIDNIRTAYKLSKKYDVEMPIVNTVYEVLFEGLDARKAIANLMTRNPKFED